MWQPLWEENWTGLRVVVGNEARACVPALYMAENQVNRYFASKIKRACWKNLKLQKEESFSPKLERVACIERILCVFKLLRCI